MSETEAFKVVASYGIGGVIAIFMFLLYRRDMKEARESAAKVEVERRAAADQRAEEYRRVADELKETVQNNTRMVAMHEATNAQLARAVEALARDKEPDHGRKR